MDHFTYRLNSKTSEQSNFSRIHLEIQTGEKQLGFCL